MKKTGTRSRSQIAAVAALALFLWLAYPGSGGVPAVATQAGSEPVVRFLLFYGETCPHCHEVMDNYLPGVFEKYGDRVEHRYLEVWSSTDNYLIMLGVEKKLSVPEDRQGSVPALVIGDQVLVGAREIPDRLEGLIDQYLAQGGVDYVSLEDLPEVILPTPEPAVEILVFFDPGSAGFAALNEAIVKLGQQYGGGLKAYAADSSQAENVQRLDELHAALGIAAPPPGTPEVLIDRRLLVGVEQIERELPGLVESYLAQGGVGIVPWEELLGGGSSPTSQPGGKPIHLAYFAQAGCQECARTTLDLRVVQERYPQVDVETFAIEDQESKALSEWLGGKLGVPEEQRLTTPMIFVGQDVLIGPDATLNAILAAVGKYAATGAERTWASFNPQAAEQNLVDRFRSFGVLTVLGAGLIDGLNPCAFATLVFFISYLAFTGRRGRDILFVGLSFTLGVFLTYLLVGVGLLRVVQSLGFLTALGKWVYLVTALLCVVLAAITFRDYFKARRGQPGEMALRLPMALRRRIHKVIRESAQVRAFVAMAFVTGFVVSLLELACTGQVYLPTIMFVLSVPELAAQAFLYLLLYCLMFILPLIVVFALSYYGTSSEQLGAFVNRHTAAIKLATGLLFVALALWMTWTMAPLFRVDHPWQWLLMAAVAAVVALGAAFLVVRDSKKPPKPAPRRRRSRA